MDPRFPAFMNEQLKTLLAELNAAQQPSNVQLYEHVLKVLRHQYDAQNETARP